MKFTNGRLLSVLRIFVRVLPQRQSGSRLLRIMTACALVLSFATAQSAKAAWIQADDGDWVYIPEEADDSQDSGGGPLGFPSGAGGVAGAGAATSLTGLNNSVVNNAKVILQKLIDILKQPLSVSARQDAIRALLKDMMAAAKSGTPFDEMTMKQLGKLIADEKDLQYMTQLIRQGGFATTASLAYTAAIIVTGLIADRIGTFIYENNDAIQNGMLDPVFDGLVHDTFLSLPDFSGVDPSLTISTNDFSTTPAIDDASNQLLQLRTGEFQAALTSLNETGSQDAAGAVRTLAIQILGRDPNSLTPDQAMQWWGGNLANGGTLQDIRNMFANSAEAANAVYQLAINVLGRDPNSLTPAQAMQGWGGNLANGGTLQDIRNMFANSPEGMNAVYQLAINVLGRDPNSLTPAQAAQGWGGGLYGTGTLHDIRVMFANSDECANNVRNLAIQILGRDPNSLTAAQAMQWWGGNLANGGTLQDIRNMFTNSPEGQAHNANH